MIGLQEVGGFSSQTEPWKLHDFKLDGDWGFYVANLPKTHHSVALGLPARLLPYVVDVVLKSHRHSENSRVFVDAAIAACHRQHFYVRACVKTYHVSCWS